MSRQDDNKGNAPHGGFSSEYATHGTVGKSLEPKLKLRGTVKGKVIKLSDVLPDPDDPETDLPPGAA